MAVNFYLSAFADEAGKSLKEQIDALKSHSYTHIEPRGLDLGNISDYKTSDIKEIKEELDFNNLKISAIGSPFGKIEITDSFEEHFEKFKKTIEIANILEAKRIRIFSFFFTKNESHKEYRDEVLRRLQLMSDYSYRHGVLCCHENEKDIYGDNIERSLDLLENLDGKMEAVFDFANFIQCGVDTKKAYRSLKGHIEYFHIKDCDKATLRIVPAGKGDGNIGEILSSYSKEFNRDCLVTLEPHLKVFEGLENLEKDGKTAKELKDDFSYPTNRYAFDVAATALDKIILDYGLTDNFKKSKE